MPGPSGLPGTIHARNNSVRNSYHLYFDVLQVDQVFQEQWDKKVYHRCYQTNCSITVGSVLGDTGYNGLPGPKGETGPAGISILSTYT
jgi:hypothetical protein